MATSRQQNKASENASWLRTFYQISHSDARWAKEQGWRVVNWTLLLFGGLLTLQQHIEFDASLVIFSLADAAVWFVAGFYLRDLYRMAKNSSANNDNIESKIPHIASVLKRHKQSHLSYLLVQFGVISVGLGLVVIAHFCWRS